MRIAGRLGTPGAKAVADITDFLMLMTVNKAEAMVKLMNALEDHDDIQHVYAKYGPHGAAMTANVITYRTRSAARATAQASGRFTIARLDFRIGDGEWNDPALVANEVVVRYRFALSGLPPP